MPIFLPRYRGPCMAKCLNLLASKLSALLELLIHRFLEASLNEDHFVKMQMQYVSVYLNALLSVFALGLHFTPGCLLPHIINKLVHAGVCVT